MTDEEYRDDWLKRLGKSIDDGENLTRLQLLREARSKPHMQGCLDAMEFMLPRLDSAVAASKIAEEIAIKAKAVVSVTAEEITVASGGTLGHDISSAKSIGAPAA